MKTDQQSQIYEFGEFRVDGAKRLLLRDSGEVIALTPKVFDTLLYLVQNYGKVVGKDELMREIWTDTIVEENNLNKNISVLRRVLKEKPGEHRFIVTVPGKGYKFVAEVRAIADLEFGISDFKPDEDFAKNESANVENQSARDDAQKTRNDQPIQDPRSKIQDQGWFSPVAVIGVLAIVAAGIYLWAGSAKTADAPIRTIAVLPFKPLLADNRNEALELGMADTLISKLSDGEKIIVRPLDSVRRMVASEQDALTAGRALDAEAVLEGSIQTSGDRLRISARLLRTADGKQLWAGKFDEKFTDIFAVQDSISERVAAALKIQLGGSVKKRYTDNVEAYQLYMKGRFHLLKAMRSEIETGISYFQKAIELDPNYTLAYAGLADAYRGLAVGGEMPSTDLMPKAKQAANKAIEVDDSHVEAHAILGHIYFWYDWDWNAAENQHKIALELDPNNADSLQFYAHLLSNTGRHAEALVKIKRAREIDPLNLRTNALEGLFLFHAGQTDQALARLEKTLELDPNFRLANMFAVRVYTEKGMFAEADAAMRRALEVSPESSEPIAFGTYALAKSGRRAEAQAALDELLRSSNDRYVPPYHFALIYNALGESEKALNYLEKGLAEKDVRMVFLKVEPKWNNLRSNPRFINLMRQMNFE